MPREAASAPMMTGGYADGRSYVILTENAAKVLHLGESYGIAEGRPASFAVLEAKDWYEALSNNAPVVLSVRKGEVIARTQPAVKQVLR